MKISTKGRYALRLMIDLAQNREQGNISLKDVSKRQEISIKYLEQIVSPLTKAGLIRSIRGSQGGYSLIRNPEEYTAKEILTVVEGPIACVSCLETKENLCSRYSSCATIKFYEGLNQVIIDYLEKYTLADLAEMRNWDYVI
ncbi:MAG: Rrf2 family transcriptional regulator [Bacilli bacterium]|nr:Rrf2 family transcriptional regulator [Bacilli bacterium]